MLTSYFQNKSNETCIFLTLLCLSLNNLVVGLFSCDFNAWEIDRSVEDLAVMPTDGAANQ